MDLLRKDYYGSHQVGLSREVRLGRVDDNSDMSLASMVRTLEI